MSSRAPGVRIPRAEDHYSIASQKCLRNPSIVHRAQAQYFSTVEGFKGLLMITLMIAFYTSPLLPRIDDFLKCFIEYSKNLYILYSFVCFLCVFIDIFFLCPSTFLPTRQVDRLQLGRFQRFINYIVWPFSMAENDVTYVIVIRCLTAWPILFLSAEGKCPHMRKSGITLEDKWVAVHKLLSEVFFVVWRWRALGNRTWFHENISRATVKPL
jgi:hypothetical protein